MPAAADAAAPAVACNGWATYTEYGIATGTAGSAARTAGTGWLGGKGRLTHQVATAGLTLMGDRLYNPTRGAFTSTDPEPGGNSTAYTYPQDPINQTDLDGRSSRWRKTLRRASTITGFIAMGACIAATAGLCMAATIGAIAASAAWNLYQYRNGDDSGKSVSGWTAIENFGVDAVTARFRPVRNFRYLTYPAKHARSYVARHSVPNMATHGLSWTARNRPVHAAIWSSVNLYYGYRSYKNGW